jgi:hypothetical protein
MLHMSNLVVIAFADLDTAAILHKESHPLTGTRSPFLLDRS